jgi:hypothetical protein
MADRSIRKKVAPPANEWRDRQCTFCRRIRPTFAVNVTATGVVRASCESCWKRRAEGRRLNYSSEY